MTVNLTSYYASVQSAEREVARIMDEMRAAVALGTPEGTATALDMRPALKEAEKSAKVAMDLYIAVRDDTFIRDDLGYLTRSKILRRPIFESLDPVARMEFIRLGGSVTD